MKKREYLPIGILIVTLVIAFYFLPILPEEIPIHWDSKGVVDDYASKYIGLFLLPLIMIVMYILITYIPSVAIHKKNIKKFIDIYFRFRVALIIFLFVIYTGTLIQALRPFPMNYLVLPTLSFLLYVTSDLMQHSKRNFFIGFRTPWTLSSDKVWKKTNQLAATFFKYFAGLILLGVIFPSLIVFFIIFPLFGGIAYLFYYSYREFQKI